MATVPYVVAVSFIVLLFSLPSTHKENALQQLYPVAYSF